MAAFCINTHSQEFKDTAKRLGVSQFELEQIAFKYGNQEGTFGQFPSDEYIKEQLDGVPNYNASEAQAKLWEMRYSKPREFDTLDQLNAAKKDALQYFSEESVCSFINADGKYELRVAEQDNEYQRIKEQAIKDDTFMKAPNGNQSNLNEQQWIQVRSKAFKDWFGDWENDPSNASKVVDENGEPLVMYHNSPNQFEQFSYNHIDEHNVESGFFFSSDSEYAKQFGTYKYPVFLSVKKPIDAGDIKLDHTTIMSILGSYQGDFKGVDGIIGNDALAEHLVPSNGWEAMIYRPEQAKSAEANRGTFEETDKNIYHGIPTIDKASRITPEQREIISKEGVRFDRDYQQKVLSELRAAEISYTDNERKSLVALAEALFDYFNNNGFQIRVINRPYSEAEATVGSASVFVLGKQAEVYYVKQAEDENSYLTLLHELLHIATLDAIPFDSEGRAINDDQLQRYFDAFVAHLSNDSEYRKYSLQFLNAKNMEEYNAVPYKYRILSHAAESPAEFLSCFLNSKEVRDTVSSITYGEGRTIFEWLRDKIEEFLSRLFKGYSSIQSKEVLDDITNFLLNYKYTEQFENRPEAVFAELEDQQQFHMEQAYKNAKGYGELFGTSQQQSQQTIDIWAGQNPTNADLSNMAYRPFTYDGRQYNSVEQAFQLAKLKYASPITQQPVDVQQALNNPNLSTFYARTIGNKIVGLDTQAWDAAKSGIMKELIKASFQQNPQALQRLLDTGDATFTHNRDDSTWKTEFPRLLMEVRGELRAAQEVQTEQTADITQEEPLYAPPTVERDFHEKEVTVATKMDNLYSSDVMTVTEIRDEANKVMDWMSDQLTQYLENPELVWSKYKRSENKEGVIAKVSQMSRKELVEYIGIGNIIGIYANEIISPTKDNIKLFTKGLTSEERAKYKLIKKNIEGLIQYGIQRFKAREGFGFQLNDIAGDTYVVSEETNPADQENPSDVNPQNEEVFNQQEHWMIDNATRDIMDNASARVKQAIADCYLLEDNGKVNEDGSKKYDITKDKLNRNERVVPINAVRSIVKWTQGALTLSDMVAKLEAKAGANPWITQIITRLKDTSGNESDFQSQFFNTFCKHFQTYSIVKRRPNGTYYTMEVNVNPALKDAMSTLSVLFKTGGFPLVNENGKVIQSNLTELKAGVDTLESFGDLTESNRSGVIGTVGNILSAIGLPQPEENIRMALTNEVKNKIWAAAKNIYDELSKVSKANLKEYNPFEYGGDHSIRGYIRTIIKPFTDLLEDTMVSSVYDSGKMYQSYITPSWTTKLFQKMHLPDKEFHQFLLNEFGVSEWFIDTKVDMLRNLSQERLNSLSEKERDELILQTKIDYIKSHPNIWRMPWLQELTRMNETQRQEAFQHKVQLNFDKQNYMRGMNDLEYVMSVFTEYFGEPADKTQNGLEFANYGFPMLSNKPSNEFVRFRRYTDPMRTEILDGFVDIFFQEMGRIQTVEARNLMEGDLGYIANFDIGKDSNRGKRGDSFKFLDYLNEYLNGSQKESALGKFIDRELHGNEKTRLTAQEREEMKRLVKNEVKKHLNTLADQLVESYKKNGLFEALRKIEGVGTSDFDVQGAIREFVWNNSFAQANLLQMLVTDKAFYKNEEDLQKRLAQVHSPGTRGNWEARDFGDPERGIAPKQVSDRKVRVLKLKDYNFKEIKDGIIANLNAIFDKRIAEATEDTRDAMVALKESILASYEKINVVDGQAFVSPTAYRKKAIAFGEWTKQDEEVYKKLMDGKANIAEIQRVFNPRKPFTYGKVTKSVNAGANAPIKTLRYGVQYKDSEYLLIMADALMRGENTGRPNLLGAIFDVMEESAKSMPTMGIDFVVFESGVKTGLQGAIDIGQYAEDADGRRKAFEEMWNKTFISENTATSVGETAENSTLKYNENFIDVLDAEDYTTQQTVPEHFMHGDLQWGSQIRALMTSDLASVYDGKETVFEYTDPASGEVLHKSAKDIRDSWEQNTAKMIKESVAAIREELGLKEGMSLADSNVLIAKILQREILGNPRYGVDLLLACSVDADGNFRIPLGDPIQSKRVEQLLSSIVKNRINKQKVEGGTLVEVTNFGATKRLNIRFKDKTNPNKLLDTQAEYMAKGHSEAEYQKYVDENQGGIAYYECYAPVWMRDLYQKFADRDGNIDVEAIEMLDPDLLKMYGYRIPTEDKYSTAPYKIVGFLPQEAGDGFMQPWETTVIDGSDFDVDKKNLMRMVLNLKSSIMSKREFFEKNGLTEETEENVKKYNEYKEKEVLKTSPKEILKNLPSDLDIVTSADPAIVKEAMVKAEKTIERRIAESNLEKAKQKAEDLKNKKTAKLLEQEGMHSEELEAITQEYNTIISNAEAAYRTRIHDIEEQEHTSLEREIVASMLRKRYLWQDSSKVPENERRLFLALKEAYLKTAFKVERPTSGKDYYNNLMFNMQWSIATNASTADKMLNPGNFDVQKRMGYMVAAARLGYDWDVLQTKSIDELKDMVMTSKNLMDFDVQTQFYRQNAVAGQILGIFAVAKSAHAMFEGRGYGITLGRRFYIDGMEFSGTMRYDQGYDRTGATLIGKTLGSLVGASADAVKDPVLNFMNINKETVNVLNTALRLGLDFDTAALLLSSKAVSDVLDAYRKNSLLGKTSFENEVKKAIRELEKDKFIGKDSSLQYQNITKEELVQAINGLPSQEAISYNKANYVETNRTPYFFEDYGILKPSDRKIFLSKAINYKILNAVLGLSEASRTAQPLTDLSRLNSITSAPGPLHINTIASDRKLGPTISMEGISKFYDAYQDMEGHTIGFGDEIGDTGVILTEDNLQQMIVAGAVETFEDFRDASREEVFAELPSLEQFYESYNIVNELFGRLKFTTATTQFADLLNAVPSGLQFSLYSKDNILGSLADFFQSYLLVQSGVIKSSELKKYTTEFVEDYIKGKYTADEKTANNPLIMAIQPKLISKKGEADRYALEIDTTGMEQQEKDALSAGWAQLEKDNPTLSHQLFVYNFFRGGIGFNPKSFMALMPIQVKERIAGYNETFINLPENMDYASIVDQWVRNNWTNTSLVTVTRDVYADENTESITFNEGQMMRLNDSPYVRVSSEAGDFLFKQSTIGSNVYKKIEPLGHNKEYVEMYPSNTATAPVDALQRGVAPLQTEESEHIDTKEDNPTVPQTQEEQARDVADFYETVYGDESMRPTETESMDAAFEKVNKDLDIQTNQSKFDDIMDGFCKR